MILARIRTIQSCHCEEWNDEAISVLVNWRLLRASVLAMTVPESFSVIKTDTTFENPYNNLDV